MKTGLAKGFQDYTGEQAEKRAEVKRIIEETFKLYGFEPAETPIIEYEDFVKGESQNETDEVVSDIFKLQDKGNRKLALRYELTFPLKRISQNKKLPYKRYQIGEVFRDEPVSLDRFREFTQCDADIIGSSGKKDEAEILATIKTISEKLKINFVIYLNNRKLLNEILEEQKIREDDKKEVIRIIDKIDKKAEKEIKQELKKYKAEKILQIFKKPESYFKKYSLYKEIGELRRYCSLYNVKFIFSPKLARGLSYYNGTIFEVKTKDTGESLIGGGAYSVNGIQSVGYGAGLDRISQFSNVKFPKTELLILSIAQDKSSIKLAENLRKNNVSCILMYDKISKALDYANSKLIENVVILGEKEAKLKKFKLKNMKTGKERLVSEKEIIKIFS